MIVHTSSDASHILKTTIKIFKVKRFGKTLFKYRYSGRYPSLTWLVSRSAPFADTIHEEYAAVAAGEISRRSTDSLTVFPLVEITHSKMRPRDKPLGRHTMDLLDPVVYCLIRRETIWPRFQPLEGSRRY